MHMSFWFGTELGSFLFPGYEISSTWGFLATCSGLISLAVIYEGMKVLRIKLHKKTILALEAENSGGSENSSLLTQVNATDTTTVCTANWKKWLRWSIEVLHWSAHTTLGYLLMLAVMTFNGYIGIALVIGASFGYWIFGMTLIDLNLAQFRQSQIKTVRCDPECADSTESAERQESGVSIIASNSTEASTVAAIDSVAEIHASNSVS